MAVARRTACVMLIGAALAAAFSLPPVGHRALQQQRGQCSSISMMAPPPSSSAANSGKLTKLPDLSAPFPNFYDEVRRQATDAVQAALKQGVRRMEIEFPIQPGRIDVSLGEFLDGSREWVREFVRPFTTKGQKLWVVFPDGKEATLAGTRWGGTNFRVMGIETAKKLPKEEACELMVIVTPGFNVEEFLDLEKIDRGVPTIIVNGNLDRVRSGYYPRLFYPGLFNVKERYLKFFESVYYLKPVQGGLLFRAYPGPWQQILTYYDTSNSPPTAAGTKKKKIVSSVVGTTEERPAYNDAVNALKRAAAAMARESG